ncbi:MAG: hypothetical protein HC808_06465 [Candidatus Competibacteraceae bacterium]|nr:hypothetical protein [Candidatus Competibacteraceae bacterium]
MSGDSRWVEWCVNSLNGQRASFATTVKEAFVIGARSFTGNPYDGHTLSEQLEQVSILCDQTPQEAYVDRGYKGHQHPGDTKIFIAGQQRGITARQRRRLRRRNTIEPIIGHMKTDGKLGRCFLHGELGDALNVILCAVGQNLRKLLRWLFCAWSLLLFGPTGCRHELNNSLGFRSNSPLVDQAASLQAS